MTNKNNKAVRPQKAKVSFYLIAFSLPFVFFLLLELILRGLGFGEDLPLFVDSPQFTGYRHVNPRIIERYFVDPEKAPDVRPDISLFKATKNEESFRIVVQGGSTAAGFPYGRSASLQAMLKQRFKRAFPEQEVEVVSTAMSSVNSYTLRDFVDEIIEQEPDLVVVYAGHNEYLGIMGVGARHGVVSGHALTLVYLRVKRWRIVQLLEQFYRLFRSDEPKEKQAEDSERSLMARFASGKKIPLASKAYRDGIRQFELNLGEILARYRQAGIPVFVGSLASNQKDQVPFSSVGEVDWHAYKETLDVTNADKNTALLNRINSPGNSAAHQYKLGLNQYLSGSFDEARKSFRQAKDLDSLRFRAPSDFNTVIRKVTDRHRAVFVDTEQLFLDKSAHHIIGDELMLEHVHPNVQGYWLMAEAFFNSVMDNNIIEGVPFTTEGKTTRQDMPVTEFEKVKGEYTIEKLTSGYPFRKTERLVPFPDENSVLGKGLARRASGLGWLEFHQQMISEYRVEGNLDEAAKIAGNVSDVLANMPDIARFASDLYIQKGDYVLGLHYALRASRLAPDNRDYARDLARAYFFLGEEDKSRAILRGNKGG